MSASDFLDRLEQQGMLEASVVADLRRQLAGASRPITAEALAKLLVENGHLTKFQATKVIDEVTARAEQRKSARAETAEARREKVSSGSSKSADSDSVLELTRMEAETPIQRAPAKPVAEDVVMLEAAEPAKATSPLRPLPFEAAPAAQRRGAKPDKKSAAASSELQPLTPLGDGLSPLENAAGLTALESETLGSGGGLEEATAGRPVAAGGFVKQLDRKNKWDSPLMLVGVGALVLLSVAAMVLLFSLRTGNADEYYNQALKDYRAESYVNAIDKFQKYLDSFSDAPDVPKARVYLLMAKLHLEENSSDPAKGLAAAHEYLPKLDKEVEFDLVRPEVATMLPRIAEKFAARAHELVAKPAKTEDDMKKADELLKSVDAAMELVNNASYIPTTLKKTQSVKIDQITELKSQVDRDIKRERELTNTLVEMQKRIDDGKTREAFQIRQALLEKYQGLATEPRIIEKVKQIGERERDQIQTTQQDIPPANDDQTASIPKIVLYSRSGAGVPDVAGETLVTLINGSVYAFDAGSGQLKWRRFVGYDTLAQPIRLGKTAEADVLLSDSARQEILRVNGSTGELVWRLPIGEAFHEPLLWSDLGPIIVSTRSGRIVNVDPATGLSRRQTNLAQPLDAGVGARKQSPICYQVGENDHLYAISIESMECREVFYLGHRPGTIVAPPVVAVGYLFIVENTQPDASVVHILAIDENGLNIKTAQEPIRLQGQIVRPPYVAGRRVIFATNLGAITALDVNPQATPPVSADLSPVAASRNAPIATHALVDQGILWVADSRLTAYELQVGKAQLFRKWISNDGATFVAPLQRVGEAIVNVRRDPNSAGFRVTAVDGESGQNTFWQADIGFPALGVAAQPDGRLQAFSSVGAAYSITADQAASGIAEAPADARVATFSFDEALALPDGKFAMFSRAGQLLVYDPQNPTEEMRLLRLNIPQNSTAADPIVLHGGILVPLTNGQIALLNPMTGDNLFLPFQAPVRPGVEVHWRTPTAVGAEQRDFVIADDQQNLYRIGVVDTGGAHLASLEQVALSEPIIGPLAAVTDTVYAVVRRSDGDVLVYYSLPRLREEGAVPLKSAVTWGPGTVGDVVMVATENELVAFDNGRQQMWTAPLLYGPLSGAPTKVDADYICSSQSGVVWRIRGSDGQEVAKHEIGEPLAGSPTLSGDTIWIFGADGTLYQVPLLTP